jgi:aryl-alcohol dehydrogenase-like predicted oxidoreductase
MKYREENCAAADIELTAEQLDRIEAAIPADAVSGARYAPEAMRRTESER